MMFTGHPATTYSEHMDYVLTPTSAVGDPNCFTETILGLDDFPSMVVRADVIFPQPSIRKSHNA